MPKIRSIISLARPIQLVLALLEYGFGLGLARYLGATILPEPQFFGGAMVLLLLAASNLLVEYFRPINEPIIPGETRGERESLQQVLLVISFTFLTVVAVLIFLLLRNGYFHLQAVILLIVLVVLAMANAVHPIRFINRGLGELSNAVMIAGIIPSLSFLLQFGSLNRILTIFNIPIFILALAYFLALNFPDYGGDIKYERQSLLVSITWQRGVQLHNVLLVAAYLFFAAIPFLGVPFGLVWPALLTLPLAAYQVFTMRNLADGARPNWPVFILNATAIFGLTIYLVALTFWLR
jgi:1,4-dihydroxy-2-naphthoate octaprenyltransferase